MTTVIRDMIKIIIAFECQKSSLVIAVFLILQPNL